MLINLFIIADNVVLYDCTLTYRYSTTYVALVRLLSVGSAFYHHRFLRSFRGLVSFSEVEKKLLGDVGIFLFQLLIFHCFFVSSQMA